MTADCDALRGVVAVVTGATRGAGRGIALGLGEADATVICTGRSSRTRTLLSDRRGLESFVSVQPEYNMIEPTRGLVEMELALACRRYGIGMFPYSPLGAGC
jgi:aryl-alcohol dehydrogenase-like predicted oxidoreductase